MTGSGATRTEVPDEEYIELHNPGTVPVPLYDPVHPENRWRLGNAVTFEFPASTSIPAQGYLIVAGLDPANTAALSAFRTKYSVPSSVPVLGPFRGRLSNQGEAIELFRPDAPQTTPEDFGFVPSILVDRVDYRPSAPWPSGAAGGGDSLQRRMALEYGNDPVNWRALPPSAGQVNPTGSDLDSDGDGMPDAWELAHGFDPHSPHDAHLDADGDGQTNLQEYLSGTNPRDPNDRLELHLSYSNNLAATASFIARPGLTYSVQYTDDLGAGTWTVLAHVEAGNTARVVDLADPSSGTATARYYRVVTPRQQ
jgi:hypothetical protein